MKRLGKFFAFLFVIIGSVWALPAETNAQTSNQAGLVVRFSDDQTETACVDFDEERISGLDLLQQSGLDFAIDVQGLGALVCSIANTGCPANDCLCQCKAGSCVYWSYWHRNESDWQYSQLGATNYQVEPGSVQGWSWGPGAVNEAVAPPNYTFEEVCQLPATDTATPSPSLTPGDTPTSIIVSVPDTATPGSTEPVTAVPSSPTSTPTNQAQHSPTPTTTTSIAASPTPRSTRSTTPIRPTEIVQSVLELPTQPLLIPTTPVINQEDDLEILNNPVNEPTSEPTIAAATVSATRKRGSVASAQIAASTNEPQQIAELLNDLPIDPVETSEPLMVVGSGVVPTKQIVQESQMSERGLLEYTFADWFPYIVFLIIVSGLISILLFQSVAKKNKRA